MPETRESLARLPAKTVSAGVLFFRGGRLLVLDTADKPYCEIPGGIVEKGESPTDAATREVEITYPGKAPLTTGGVASTALGCGGTGSETLKMAFDTYFNLMESTRVSAPAGSLSCVPWCLPSA